MLKTSNIKLYVVETAFGDRHFEVTDASNPNHLQLRTSQNIWHKENMINLGIRHLLPRDWKYVAWVDGDVYFQNDNWATETLHALQHYNLIQPWSEAIDMGPNGESLQMFRSFASLVAKGVTQQVNKTDPYPFGHPGFAYAATRTLLENTGGVMDFPVLGSADAHMAWGSINKVEMSMHDKMNPEFKRLANDWQTKAYQVTQGRIGYIPGTIHHAFHGPKTKRFYRERWQILVDHDYNPTADLRRDANGLIYIVGKPALVEDIHRYMISRQEDSIEMD